MGRSELADEWQRWLADNLLRGVADEVLIERLAERGLPEPDARAAVAAARGHPFVRAAGPGAAGRRGAAASRRAARHAG